MNAGLRNFWKWSLLVFLAVRSSDVVQSLIGLWLVPKCVPAADVGAFGTNAAVNWKTKELKLWVVQSVGSGSVDVGKARDAATDRFFARKQDNSTLESYTGRTK